MTTQDECKMCKHPTLAKKWSNDIIKGIKTSVDAADVFKMSIEDVENHVYHHQTTELMVKPERNKEYFVEKLDAIQTQLDEVLESTMVNPEMSVRNVTSLTKEIRETLKLIAEVEGIIGADNYAAMQKNLEGMKKQYAELTGWIIENCCPDCQKRIVAKMRGDVSVDGTQNKLES